MFMQSLNDYSVIWIDHGFIIVTCNNRKRKQYDLGHKNINIILVQTYSCFFYLPCVFFKKL